MRARHALVCTAQLAIGVALYRLSECDSYAFFGAAVYSMLLGWAIYLQWRVLKLIFGKEAK